MKRKHLGRTLALMGVGGLIFLGFMLMSRADAQLQDVVDTRDTQKVTLYQGDLVSLKVYSLTRLAVTIPGIVEFGKVEVNEILLIGQHEGETSIFIWDQFGKRKITVNVISQDLDQMIDRINVLLTAAKVKGLHLRKNIEEQKIIITGKVPKDKTSVYTKVIDPFLVHILDLTTESGELIQIDVQITELTTTLAKTLGFLWSTGTSGLDFQYQETIPANKGNLGDLFRIGDFTRTTAIQTAVNMLLAEGKARVLSKPSIIVTAGESATFLVGGEIPVRTTTTSEGSVSENISYKSYGVDLTVTPTINVDKIDLDLSVSVTDIDASNAVGNDTAFTTRSANTKLSLNDKQTIILAGFIKSNKGEQVTRVPVLSKIPIIGLLFRSKNWTPNKEEELVISITPTILKDKKIKKVEYPERSQSSSKRQGPPPGAEGAASETGGGLSDEDLLTGKGWGAPEEAGTDQAGGGGISPAGFPRSVPGDRYEDRKASQAVTAYAQSIQKKISQGITYPDRAHERGWEGVVTLALDVLSDGSLVDVSIEESSGYEILDTDAVNTAQLSAPFDPFPQGIPLEEIRVTLPIIYSQEDILEDALWR